MATGSYLSIITLNVKALNSPTKRQRLAEWIQKQDPYICYLQETHLQTGDTYRLKVKKIFHANRDQKKAGVAILISDKIDLKIKAVKRDKEGHYIMIKGSTQEEDITIINAPNIGAPQYVRQMLTSMKGEEKAMATHSSVLSWRIPGTGEPGGLPSMGSHRVGHN